MGNCLSVYGECKKERYSNNYVSAGLCSMRGSRETMEDCYCVCLSIPNHPFYSLFAVFDGFNGYSASQYLRNGLVSRLNELYSLSDDKLIIDAINKMDKKFLNSKDEDININAGSTLVFALINNQFTASSEREGVPSTKCSKVRIFWAGDSRALVMRENNDFEALTNDHHCNVPSEKKRICNPLSNASIINGKIDGITELSRSFGCYQMKNNKTLKSDEQKLISVAECKHISCESNETLLLFSDGLLQKWSNKQVVKNYNFHYNQHKNYQNPMVNSLNYFIQQCIDDGSRDNITAISIKFK